MGLFDELDIASAADNPWTIPDNTYPCVVSDLEVKDDKNGNKGMIFKYKVREGEHAGFELSEYKRLPSSSDKTPLDDAEKAKAMSYIKLRLASLGIPEARMNSVEKSDLVGLDCYVSTQIKGEFINVRQVTTENPGGVSATTGVKANPFA